MSERRRKQAAMAAALELLRESVVVPPSFAGSLPYAEGRAYAGLNDAVRVLRAARVDVGPATSPVRREVSDWSAHRYMRTRLALYLRAALREGVGRG